MNRKLALALVSATLAAGNAFAEIGMDFTQPAFVSTKSRAEVQAELAAFQRANPSATPLDDAPAIVTGSLSRAQVLAELAEHQRANPWGVPAEMAGEYSPATYARAKGASPVAAQQVAGKPLNAQ